MNIGAVNMREYIINNSLNLIKRKNPDYTEEKMEILEYGLTGLYILITKTIIIFTIAYFLGILKELMIFMVIYSLIRSVSFGIHATSSIKCLIISSVLFMTAAYCSKTCVIDIGIKTILSLISLVYISIHSPADTEKKPIINSKRRLFYKALSTIIALMMSVGSIIVGNNLISNCLFFSLIIQCIMISPLTYKLTNQKYNNYKYYKN